MKRNINFTNTVKHSTIYSFSNTTKLILDLVFSISIDILNYFITKIYGAFFLIITKNTEFHFMLKELENFKFG